MSRQKVDPKSLKVRDATTALERALVEAMAVSAFWHHGVSYQADAKRLRQSLRRLGYHIVRRRK